MKKLLLGLLFIFIVCFGFYLWASSGGLSTDKDRYVIFSRDDLAFHQKDTFSIMTFNIGYLSGMTNNKPVSRTKDLFNSNLNALIQVLDNHPVDILALQEIDFNSSRSFNRNQLELIQNKADFSYAAQAVNWDKNYVPFPYWPLEHQFGKIESGQALVSRFPILNHQVELLSKPIDKPFYYNDFYLDRLIQTTKIKLGGSEIVIMNVHLEAFSSNTRAMQLQIVYYKFLEQLKSGPTILAGDFNESYLSKATAPELAIFFEHEAIKAAVPVDELDSNLKKHYTYSAEIPDRKIDYIFYSSDFIEMIESKTIRDINLLSDHLPVLLRFKLKSVNRNLTFL